MMKKHCGKYRVGRVSYATKSLRCAKEIWSRPVGSQWRRWEQLSKTRP